MQSVWFTLLIYSACLEGLGRRYLPFIPQEAFYFLKDVILLFGWVLYRPSREIRDSIQRLYGGFSKVVLIAFLWTVAEMFNPGLQSILLGFVGLRSYWLWWLAPGIIAMALQKERDKQRAIYALVVLAGVVSLFAALQFSAPADSELNMYSVWNGEQIYASNTAIVAATGRARVASTFAFITGFVDFTLLVPALLLSLGLDSSNPRVRTSALVATMMAAAVVPMSGSRSSVVIGLAILGLALWSAGLFFTRTGRRILIGAAVAATLAVVAFPDALAGVESRFEANPDETNERFEGIATNLPLVAMARYDYPALGLGTGMQQNARMAFKVPASRYDIEPETGRYLVELGPFGFLLIWTAKAGLMVALFRAYFVLKRARRRGSAAAALCYGALTMIGNLAFDHNWQALYFSGCGLILSEVVAVNRRKVQSVEAPVSVQPAPGWTPLSVPRDPAACSGGGFSPIRHR